MAFVPRFFISEAVLGGAVGADAFHHVVHAFEHEVFRQVYDRYRQTAQTKRAVAAGAIEMGVQVVDVAGAFVGAYRIFQRAGAVVDAVDEVMLQEQRERARHGGLVDRLQRVNKVEQRHCAAASEHGFQYHKAQSRRLYFP